MKQLNNRMGYITARHRYKMEFSKRKLFFLIIGFSGVILIILANFVGPYSSHRVYIVAANFHNNNMSHLTAFNMNISILSDKSLYKPSAVNNFNNSWILSRANNDVDIHDANRVNIVGNLRNSVIDNNSFNRDLKHMFVESLSDSKETNTGVSVTPDKGDLLIDKDSDVNDGGDALEFESERYYKDDETEAPTTVSRVHGRSRERKVNTEIKGKKNGNDISDKTRAELGKDLANVANMFIENQPENIEVEPNPIKTENKQNNENLKMNMHNSEKPVPLDFGIKSLNQQQHHQKGQIVDLNREQTNVVSNSKLKGQLTDLNHDHTHVMSNNKLANVLLNKVGIKRPDSAEERITRDRSNTVETLQGVDTGAAIVDDSGNVDDGSKISRNIHMESKIAEEPVGFLKDPNCHSRPTMAEDILCLKRPKFLSDYRNPCWHEGDVLRCLPYFYIIGVCKTGSTDLFERLSHHPQVVKNHGLLGKETWYWSWNRYGHSNFYRSYRELMPFDEFIDKFDAYHIESITKRQPNGTLYHPAVTGHGDPMDFWDHSSWQMIPQNDPSWNEPNITTPSLVKHVNPNIKLILLLRDPVERLFSNYLHGKFGETAEQFHDDVLRSLSLLSSCRESKSMKSCLYDSQIIQDLNVPISGSFYSIHLKEWLKVFPRKQMFIIRTEDFSTNVADTLLRIFRFLKLDPIPTRDLYRIANMPHFYDTKAKQTAGEIKSETREILETLFEPYNTDLAHMLNDENFNFNTS